MLCHCVFLSLFSWLQDAMLASHFEIVMFGNLVQNIMQKSLCHKHLKGTMSNFSNALSGVSSRSWCTGRGSKILDLLRSATISQIRIIATGLCDEIKSTSTHISITTVMVLCSTMHILESYYEMYLWHMLQHELEGLLERECILCLSLWTSLSGHSTWELIVLIQLEGCILLLERSLDVVFTWELLEHEWFCFNLRVIFFYLKSHWLLFLPESYWSMNGFVSLWELCFYLRVTGSWMVVFQLESYVSTWELIEH